MQENIPCGPRDPTGQPLCIPTPASAYKDLRAAIHLPAFGVTHVIDPFAGTGSTLRGVAPLPVVTNDINPVAPTRFHLNMLQPGAIQSLTRALGTERSTLHAVVTAPQYAHLDLVLPLLVGQVDTICCVFTHVGYLEDNMPTRNQYLAGLSREGRLRVVTCKEIMPHHRMGVWICVCAGELASLMAHQGGELLYPG